MSHTICYLFGHEWPKNPIPGTDDDGEWPKFICKFCEEEIDLPRWDGVPEGVIPEKIYWFRAWACGFFLGHEWCSSEIGDSGDWDSRCDRCGIDADDAPDDRGSDGDPYHLFKRIKDWFEEYEWPWLKS